MLPNSINSCCCENPRKNLKNEWGESDTTLSFTLLLHFNELNT